nr:xylulose kinase-1 [Tanacetum cinerariifolium]
MEMEYSIMNTDHNLWKIIQNGNSKNSLGRDSKGGIIILLPVSFKEHVVVQREIKARTLLLQSLPEDHMADFHHLGNEESKKIRKTMLKQEFLEFSVSEEEGLHKGYDRALPPSWSQVSLTLKTKGGLEYLSFDDLYNKLRSRESDVKGGSSYGSRDVLHSFVAKNEPTQQLAYEDFEHVDQMEMEELDIKWHMAMLSLRINRECNVKKVDEKARCYAFKISEVKTEEPKAMVSVDPMLNWNEHEAENKTEEGKQVYGLMARFSQTLQIMLARFSGNEESKKIRKTMLKQEFSEFSVSEEEGLHKGYDRALPPSWSQVSLTLKTRGGLEYLSFDDLYNKIRSLESDVKGGSSYGSRGTVVAPTHSAFIGAASTNTKMVYFDKPSHSSLITYTFAHYGSIMKDVLHSFVTKNEPTQQLAYEDFEHVDQMEMEELDIKWH